MIAGTVFGLDSRPVVGAKVFAMPVGGGLAMGLMIPWAATDSHGHFAISRLPLMRYVMGAGNLSGGYADGFSAGFYHDSTTPSVTLTTGRPTVSVVIRLLQKPGLLIGTIRDAETGEPIEDAGAAMTVRRPKKATFGGSLASSFRLLVPSGRSVAVEFRAPGYKSVTMAFQLAPGAARRIRVRLLRQPKP